MTRNGFLFGVMNMFWNYIMVMAAQPYKYTKSHRIVHSKMVNSVACDVNLNLKRNSVLAR